MILRAIVFMDDFIPSEPVVFLCQASGAGSFQRLRLRNWRTARDQVFFGSLLLSLLLPESLGDGLTLGC